MAEPPYNLRSRHRQSRREESRDDLSANQNQDNDKSNQQSSLLNSNNSQEYSSSNRQFSKSHPELKVLGFTHWLFIIGLVASFYALSIYIDSHLPSPLPDNQFSQFSETRARKFLVKLSDLGPRPSGSDACEIEAVKLVHDELESIRTDTNRAGVNRMEIDTQHPSGCFDLGFLTDFTLCYRNVTNILARFGPNNGPTEHSVLVNCHFDTMPDSPGATDDGVSCAIMMEMLRIFSRMGKPLENDVIFLFNGAEENFLQASHGFITTHPWRHSIRAFINLEGAGAGGRELLFQAGPGNGWLVKAYLENAPRPHCSVLGQEVFQSGVMPSDTDFRVFRDFGRVPGLDIAYVRNGYVYHTEFDTPQFIPSGAIQRAGENTLGALRGMLASKYLAHPGDYNEGSWVFYDVIGLFVLSYSQSLGEKINLISVLLVVIKIVFNCSTANKITQKGGITRETSYGIGLLLSAISTHLLAVSMVVLTGVFMTQLLCVLDLNMVWYSQPWLIFFIYFLPQIMAGLAVHCFFATKFYRKRDPFLIEQCHFDAMLAVYASLLLLLTYLGLASAFFLMIHVVFPLLREVAKFIIHRRFPHLVGSASALLFCQIVSLAPVILIGCYSVMFVFEIFIPVMGRFGQAINPEFFIMGLAAAGASSFTLYTSNLMYISRRIWYLLKCGLAIVSLLLLLLVTTRLGEPYKYSDEAPRLRRIIMLHVNRRIYTPSDELATNESGLWVLTMDYRGAEDLPMHGYMQGSRAPDCSNTHDFYCQLPYYAPIADMAPPARTRWLSLPTAPPLPQPIQLQLKAKEIVGPNRVNLTFSLDGPDHMSLHVTPINGWKLDQWSFTKLNPFYNSQNSYFLFICYGRYSGPMDFWISLISTTEKSDLKSKQLELVAASAHSHGKEQLSEPLKQTLSLMKSRRKTPQLAVGWWKWAIAPISGCSELISRYF